MRIAGGNILGASVGIGAVYSNLGGAPGGAAVGILNRGASSLAAGDSPFETLKDSLNPVKIGSDALLGKTAEKILRGSTNVGTANTQKQTVNGKPPESGGLESFKGYKPQPGERTIEGFIKNNAPVEIPLKTSSQGFNNNFRDGIGGEFKRIGADSHGGLSPHVHQPIRNQNPSTGEVFGQPGRKTYDGGVTSPTEKDIKQLYENIFNNKYK